MHRKWLPVSYASDGMTVGAVANRTKKYDEEGKETASFEARLTTAGCEKAAAFVKTCDAFNIPVLTLTNVEGYATSVEEEKTIAAAAAKLTAAFAESDVPKVNMITGNAYGSAYITMNSKHIGADMVFALNGAKVGMMDANVAAKIMYAMIRMRILQRRQPSSQLSPEQRQQQPEVMLILSLSRQVPESSYCMLLRCFITNVSIRLARNMEPSK